MSLGINKEDKLESSSSGNKRMKYDNENQNDNEKYIDWDEYFMAFALLAAKRSKDPVTQVGACIVNNGKIIVGLGYNGFPRGCNNFPWGKQNPNPLDNKKMYVVHAEMNAILNKNCCDVKDCIIYVTLFPCNECAKVIIQSGIKEVIYLSDKNGHRPATIGSKKILDAAGIKYRQYELNNEKIVLNFS